MDSRVILVLSFPVFLKNFQSGSLTRAASEPTNHSSWVLDKLRILLEIYIFNVEHPLFEPYAVVGIDNFAAFHFHFHVCLSCLELAEEGSGCGQSKGEEEERGEGGGERREKRENLPHMMKCCLKGFLFYFLIFNFFIVLEIVPVPSLTTVLFKLLGYNSSKGMSRCATSLWL